MNRKGGRVLQEEKIDTLKQDPRQMKQLKVMFGVVDEAFRNNMHAYIKLVQMDVMKEFNARCDADGVGGDRVKFSHGMMDQIMVQVNSDLESRIMSQFAKLKGSLQEDE